MEEPTSANKTEGKGEKGESSWSFKEKEHHNHFLDERGF